MLFREELVLHPLLQERVDQFLQHDISGRRTIGVHVRYSDHYVRLWAILKKLNSLLQQDPELQVFLSTDNIEVKHMFERNYPGTITAPHWYPARAGLPIHTDPAGRKRPRAEARR